jgi:hypothetical protein
MTKSWENTIQEIKVWMGKKYETVEKVLTGFIESRAEIIGKFHNASQGEENFLNIL